MILQMLEIVAFGFAVGMALVAIFAPIALDVWALRKFMGSPP